MKRNIIFSLALLFITTAFCAVGTRAACTVFVTNNSDSSAPGSGSLRAAIFFANGNPGTDTICFHIPGAGGLPFIGQPVIIDGYTQPGSSANTLATSDNAVLNIELNGTLAGGGANGLTFFSNASGSTVRGLVINGFNGRAIGLGGGGTGFTIEGNFIGTDPTGTLSKPNQQGMFIANGSNFLIGGSTPAARNLISGNVGNGVQFANITNSRIEGNFIGTDCTGTLSVPNGQNGNGAVFVGSGSTNNTIGGPSAAARNIISGNRGAGIGLSNAGTNGNRVLGNYIGTDASGMAALGNRSNGISVDGASNNLIEGNVISDSGINIFNAGGHGISIFASNPSAIPSGNVVRGNKIGTNAAGTGAIGNAGNGLTIANGTSGNVIDSNTIAFNHDNGVGVFQVSLGNRITQNSIFSNGKLGIELSNDSVTPNDACDGDTGPNNLQNYPTLTSLALTAGVANITGSLDSTPGTQFSIEFFANSSQDPSGYGEGKTFIGSTVVTTAGCSAGFTGSFAVPADTESISATATNTTTNDTSEFSAWFATSSTSVSSHIDPSTYGQSVTFTASVSSTAGTPGDSVTFMDGATVLGNGTLNGSGEATFATSDLGAGSHSITAVYGGSTNYDVSTSAALDQVVNPANTTTGLTSSQNLSADGQSVTFTATVTTVAPGAGTPSGTVTFKDGATVLANVPVDGTGTAVFATSSLSNGPHLITATYNSTANFNGSSSSSVSQLVYGVVAGGGSFVVGNGNAAVGTNVTFWGAQWASRNSLSGGAAPSSFTGFADQSTGGCGSSWTTRPGNSSKPPDSIPGYMAVIVASSASKSGSTISGNTTQIVIVKTNHGYDSNPGHAGTGTIVGVLCH